MWERVTEEAILERMRKRYYARKAAGICPNCGGPRGERVYCPACREMMYECEKRQRGEREQQGLCKKCGRPLMGNDRNYKNCFRCRVKSAERAQKYQKAHPRSKNGKEKTQ